MEATKSYEGGCFCGAVQLRVTGVPVQMGYCHCDSCRRWGASPVNAFTLWPPEAVSITRGAEHVATYHRTPRSYRKWCRVCGGHLMTEHPHWRLVDVYAAALPSLPFAGAVHVHYQETVLPMRDALPKFRDVPAAMGGSGATMEA